MTETGKKRLNGALKICEEGLLLFIALAGVLLGCAEVYGLDADLPLLLWAAAGAALLFAAYWNLKRRKLVLGLGMGVVYGLLLWRFWGLLGFGEVKVRCAVVNTLADKLSYVDHIQPVDKLPQEAWRGCMTLFLLLAGLALAFVLAFLLCRAVWTLPAILLTALPLVPALCVTTSPGTLPMGLLLGVWGTWVLTHRSRKTDREGALRAAPISGVLMGAAVAALFCFLTTQGHTQSWEWAQLGNQIVDWASRFDISRLATDLGLDFWQRGGSSEYVGLTGNGVSTTGRTALRVETNRSGKYYLRGWSSDVYTGKRWEPLGKEEKEELEELLEETGLEPMTMVGQAAYRPVAYSAAPDPSGGKDRTEVIYNDHTMTVENVAAPGGCVYYPYALYAVPEGAYLDGDSHLGRETGAWEHTITFVDNYEAAFLPSYDWIVSSSFLPPAQRSYEKPAGEGAYRDYVYAHELQVPESLRPKLDDFLDGWLKEWWGAEEDLEMYRDLDSYARYSRAWSQWNQIAFGLYREDPGIVQDEEGALWRSEGDNGEVDGPWSWGDQRYGDATHFVIGTAAVDDEPEGGLWTGSSAEYGEGPLLESFPDYWRGYGAQIEVTPEIRELYLGSYTNLMVEVVQQALWSTAVYDQTASAPPAGEDYVDWFLNGSRRGYCMHFATAATLLLRSRGIPARYVGGYVVDVPRSGRAVVPDSAAHAWVEIYVDGVGWRPVEVTPGYQGEGTGELPAEEFDPEATPRPTATAQATPSAAPTPAIRPSAAPTPSAQASQTPAPTPSAAPGGPKGPGGSGGTGKKVDWRPLGWGLLALLALAGAVLARWGLLERRRRRLQGPDTNAAVLWALRCHRRLERWGCGQDDRLEALGKKAKFSQHVLTGEERAQALEVLERDREGTRKALPWWKKPWFRLVFG